MTDPVVVESYRPFAAVAASGVAAILIVLSARRPTPREGWTILAAVVKFGLVLSMVPDALAGREHLAHFGTLVPGVEFAFRADPLGLLFGVVASGLYVLTAVYSIGYLRGLDDHERTRFFAALAGSLSATMGVAFATNLLVLFLFYELLTVATYPLVAHDETHEARRAGYKYLAYALSGGVLVVFGTVLTFWLAGTVTFDTGGIEELAAVANTDPRFARTVFGVLIVGFGVKAAIMPLHPWLPSAMVAPTPVSGLLHAVAVVKSGVFGIARTVLEVFGPETVAAIGMGAPLAIAAATTMLLGSLLALRQDDLKRLLAYSTIAQLSYIVLGIALLSPASIAGGLLHLPAHAFAKLTLFFCAGALYVELRLKKVSELAGVGRRMPLTMTAFATAAFSMAGIPLFAGFVSKWYLLVGGIEAGWAFVPFLLVASGVVNVAYFWPIVYTAFFESAEHADPKPIVDGPIGGATTTAPRPDGGIDDTQVTRGDHATGSPGDQWERADWWGGETSWLLVGPILATALVVVAFGVAVDWLFFADATRAIVDAATGVRVP
ncbi:cation:proton antiporter [Halorubrum luteum]